MRAPLESFLRGKLSSEMPQLFTLLSTVPLMKTRSKKVPWSSNGQRAALPERFCECSSAACTNSQRSRSQTLDEAEESVTELQFRKAIFLASAFCLSNVRCFLRG